MNGLREKFRNKKGFTLIEMLIVVAIIAILVAISIPLVGEALEKARDATDQANERAAKAEGVMAILDVSTHGLTFTKAAGTGEETATAYYDAANGSLVAANNLKGYGKCTCATLKYETIATRDSGLSSNDKAVLELTLNKTKGTVTLKWVAAGAT